ncbi:hypothetical protein NB703_004428 [Pantoea ananatis]|uniref:Transposase n=1 Tax=Pantoea ananas TaxID=553 RepID=A0AAJ1FUL6_PANAN|nr:hypothetical protein [Pantoea ananatis]MCW0353318.1 hypothetical protein [Pantoea ananatis]
MSLRQACRTLSLSRTVYFYQPDTRRDEPVIHALTELAERYPRYGFKKLFQLLRNRAIVQLREEIGQRLEHPLLVSVYPHRVGRRSCTAVHLSGANNSALDILITVTGNTLWPTESDYRTGIRWNICVPDATDMLWVLREIDRATEAERCH